MKQGGCKAGFHCIAFHPLAKIINHWQPFVIHCKSSLLADKRTKLFAKFLELFTRNPEVLPEFLVKM